MKSLTKAVTARKEAGYFSFIHGAFLSHVKNPSNPRFSFIPLDRLLWTGDLFRIFTAAKEIFYESSD